MTAGTSLRESTATGIEAVRVATEVLERVRLSHPTAGVWEAGDVQWWWRRPRASDDLAQPYWSDDDGPVAMTLVTEWGDNWHLDAIVVPEFYDDCFEGAFARGMSICRQRAVAQIEVLADEDDATMVRVLSDAGFVGEPAGGVSWMDADSLTDDARLPDGYELTDRSRSPTGVHWLAERNGPDVESRLRECSLYDPELDLALYTTTGELASYALLWLDRTTRVGMIEPMRTQDEHQRRGLARAILSIGLRRLADRGARRLRVGWATEAARDLYAGLGFQQTQSDRAYRGEP